MSAVFLTLGITFAVSLVTGLAMRGSPRRLAELHLVGMPALLVAVAAGLAPLYAGMSDGAARALVTVANMIVLAFIAINVPRHLGAVRTGFALLLAGWLLNAMVITANGAMPLSRWAYEQSGQHDAITAGEGGFFKIEEANASTRLRFLGDVIPIRPIKQVLSLGDLVLMAGIGFVIVGGMRGGSANPSPRAVIRPGAE